MDFAQAVAVDYAVIVVRFAAVAVPDVEDFVQADSVQRMVEFVVQNVEILANLYFVLSEEPVVQHVEILANLNFVLSEDFE